MRTISSLSAAPHTMPLQTQVLYKWILPQLKEARYALERATGRAVDIDATSERNTLMYESAEPLARLYSPLFLMDDTFVLQEFFVPKGALAQWVDAARPAFELAASLDQIELLNTTVRFVRRDTDTLLAYATAEEGSFAFVIYYRVHRSPEADAQLERVHTLLARASLDLAGCFYLPYRHHYTESEMDAAFPAAAQFFRKKQQFDPHCLFRSSWYERYGRRFWDTSTSAVPPPPQPLARPSPPPLHRASSTSSVVPAVSDQRSDSYRRLLRDPRLRAQFRDQFLTQIFNVEDHTAVYNGPSPAIELGTSASAPLALLTCRVRSSVGVAIAKAARDPRNEHDVDCFVHLQGLLVSSSGALATAVRSWKQLRQLRAQKQELLRETMSVFAQLGRLGSSTSPRWGPPTTAHARTRRGACAPPPPLVGYVSIGDHGKMVLDYRRALELTGKVWVVHDVNADNRARPPPRATDGASDESASDWAASDGAPAEETPSTLPSPSPPVPSRIPSHRGATPAFSDVLERGSLEAVGEFVPINYQQIEPLHGVPDGAADLVTMHQGLHHLPQAMLMPFLQEVFRVLRPSGLFIVREHDASAELTPMLDMAHSVFNALTGVSADDERTEIRAFRSVLEWRDIIEAAGFVDSMVYEMEKGDPTLDEMMCFIKPCNEPEPPPPLQLHAMPLIVPPSSVPPQLSMAVQQAPHALLDLLHAVQSSLATALPQLEEYALGRAEGLPGRVDGPQRVRAFFAPLKLVVARFGPVLEHVHAHDDLVSRLPLEEIFLLIRSLRHKGERGEGTPTEMMAIAAIKELQAALGVSDAILAPASADSQAPPAAQSDTASKQVLDGATRVPQRLEHVAVDEADGAAERPHDVTPAAVEDLMTRLLAAKPQLARADLMDAAGFPPRAQVAIRAKLDGVHATAVSCTLAQLLDVQV
jgi:SAM-dependent methyltransferase